MQIDFHHAVTYVTARLAGFEHKQADIIAYAAQYVDDATSSGVVTFSNGAMYFRISSAHKMLDPDNLRNPENHLSWLPFHFLPGNDGLSSDKNPDVDFIHKIICRPNSPAAREMVDIAIAEKDKPSALHRLGITLHVYADTFAHQGFAGVLHDVNDVVDASDLGNSGVFGANPWNFLKSVIEENLPAIGHARAGVFPDMPFLNWSYKNGLGEPITRNNTNIFCDAANALCKVMQRYLNTPQFGINDPDMQLIRKLFSDTKQEDGKKRHQLWLAAIAAGRFSFGAATLSYADDGRESWKAKALGTSTDMPIYPYQENFLQSDWKLFHDALQRHRLTLLHEILPKYGICAG